MLTQEEYTKLSAHLSEISTVVPYKWGRMQLKELDRKLPKLFEYKTYDELNAAIEHNVQRGIIVNTEEARNYYRHRWFIYKCSEVDEYLFKTQPNVINEGSTDPNKDFTFKDKFGLDLKGTVILKQYKDKPNFVFENPLALIDSYYKQQSQDFHYRRRLQNRLFVVHHSFISPEREPILRTEFGIKSRIFEEYAKLVAQPEHQIYDYLNGRKADIIFFVEKEDGSYQYGIGSENLKGAVIFKPIEREISI